jgi:hypothetical protein
MNELFEGDVSCSFSIQLQDDLINGVLPCFWTQGGQRVLEFLMG